MHEIVTLSHSTMSLHNINMNGWCTSPKASVWSLTPALMLRRSDLSSYHLAGETEHYYITALQKYSESQDLVSRQCVLTMWGTSAILFFHFSSPQTGTMASVILKFGAMHSRRCLMKYSFGNKELYVLSQCKISCSALTGAPLVLWLMLLSPPWSSAGFSCSFITDKLTTEI